MKSRIDSATAIATRQLRDAARRGKLEEIVALLPLLDAPSATYTAMSIAAENGHAHCVRELIHSCDPRAKNSEALRFAALGGHLDCVRILLQVSDPKANDSEALFNASDFGHLECVRALIPVSDVDARNGRAVRAAARYAHHTGDVRVLEELAACTNMQKAFAAASALSGDATIAQMLQPFALAAGLRRATRAAGSPTTSARRRVL